MAQTRKTPPQTGLTGDAGGSRAAPGRPTGAASARWTRAPRAPPPSAARAAGLTRRRCAA
eukprot:2405548-Prymnesium_polylepis.1